MYILDTSYLIDIIRGEPGAVELAKKLEEEKAYLAISIVTVHEYLLGVFLSHWRNKRKLKKMLEKAETELSMFDIIPYDIGIAKKSAEIMAKLLKSGEPLSLSDVIIAATAITYDLKLITRNIKHFSRIPELKIITY